MLSITRTSSRVNDELYRQIVLRGETLVKQMSEASVLPVASRDFLVVEEIVRNVGQSESVVEASIISLIEVNTTRRQRERGITDIGTYIAHSDPSLIGQQYHYPEGLHEGNVADTLVEITTPDGSRRLRFRCPLVYTINGEQRTVGTAELLMDLDEIQHTSRDFTYDLALQNALTATAIIFALIILFTIILRPLRHLMDAMDRLKEGDFRLQVMASNPSEIGMLTQRFNTLAYELHDLQNKLLEQERIKRDLEIAHTIQQALLPNHIPEIPGLQLAAHYNSATSVGGDYYDVVQVNENTWAFIIADVSGKGISGSLVMSMTRSILRSLIKSGNQPYKVLSRCNKVLYQDIPLGMFVTIALVFYNTDTGEAIMASAGHNPPLLRRGNRIMELRLQGIPLGADDSGLFEELIKQGKFTLIPGDFLFLYTDGVTEAMNREGALFGMDRLQKMMLEFPDGTMENFCILLNQMVDAFRKGTPPNDDISFIAIRKKSNPVASN